MGILSADSRPTMRLPEALFERFRRLAGRLQAERGGNWTDPATVEYLLDQVEGAATRKVAKPGRKTRGRK